MPLTRHFQFLLHIKPRPLDIGKQRDDLTLPLQHFLQSRFVVIRVGVFGGKPLDDIVALGGQDFQFRFQRRQFLLQRFARVGGALPRRGLLTIRGSLDLTLPPCPSHFPSETRGPISP